MKENWPRQMPAVALDGAAAARLVLPFFPGESLRSFAPVDGGLVNTNYKVVLERRPAPLLLRLYQRGAEVAAKERAIAALVAARVPVLRCLHFADANPVTGHPYAILDWLEAPDLQHCLPQLSDQQRRVFGRKIGTVLAAIHSFKFDICGFFDGPLNLEGPLDFDRHGLMTYLQQTLVDGQGGARLGRDLTRDLITYADRYGACLSAWLGEPCLVHGDFNAANILVDTAQDKVAAIIDWEYALSATPAIDFGNLLRPPFDNDDAFTDGLTEGYLEAGGFLPHDWRRIAQLADVFAFADILARPEVTDIVVEDARRVIARTITRL